MSTRPTQQFTHVRIALHDDDPEHPLQGIHVRGRIVPDLNISQITTRLARQLIDTLGPPPPAGEPLPMRRLLHPDGTDDILVKINMRTQDGRDLTGIETQLVNNIPGRSCQVAIGKDIQRNNPAIH